MITLTRKIMTKMVMMMLAKHGMREVFLKGCVRSLLEAV